MKKAIKYFVNLCGFDIRRYNLSDEAIFKRYIEYVSPDLIIDIGANIGQAYDYMRSGGYEGRIISFEPLSYAHQRLVKRAVDDELWEIAPRMALGDYDGECRINVSRNYVSSSILNIMKIHNDAAAESEYVDNEIVRCATVETIWNDNIGSHVRAAFIKIDVQGYEDKVIRGIGEKLRYVTALQVELSSVPLYEGQKILPEMLEMIYELGFLPFAFLPGFSDKESGRILQYDGLFFKK